MRDTVCLTDDWMSCADDFKWLAIETHVGFSTKFDGVMGMQSGADGDTSRLYIPYLFEKDVISENVFSFYLTDTSETSYIDFGTPNTSVMKYHEDGEEGIVWLDIVEDDPWWTNYITGFYWG